MKSAVVTGAGSGVGRAVALQLAKQGWSVALLGRRLKALEETRTLAGNERSKNLAPFACDIGDSAAVADAAAQILGRFHEVHALVNSAGINIPARSWEVLSAEGFQRVLDTNLNGVLNCVMEFLPGMRSRGEGTIVNIISDAGLAASPKAGAAYVASKFAVRGLTQSINAEERLAGIRATAILPGDINTPLLDQRPVPPPAEVRGKMLQADDVADCVMFAINLPYRAVIEELLVRPRVTG